MLQPLQIDMNQPNNAVNGGQGAANAGAGGNANTLPHSRESESLKPS